MSRYQQTNKEEVSKVLNLLMQQQESRKNLVVSCSAVAIKKGQFSMVLLTVLYTMIINLN